jgi:hypothetical protein
MTRRFDADSGSETVSPAPQPTHLEIPMESALSPREIQARIRAGDSVEEVAAVAEMPLDWVERFASPVLAEREYVAQQAQKHQVRRGGETIAHRNLGQVVNDRLSSRRVSTDALDWDAYRMEGKRWLVKLDYDSGKSHHEARFVYDANGRFSVADNDDARWLLGLHSASHGPQPGRRRREEESEPTVDLNDDIALVRVVQPRVDELPDPEDTTPLEYAEFDDAYAEAELAEVDGIYDILPSQQTNMDVLYDMLSSFDEDSVQIYTGLLSDEERSVPPTELRARAHPQPDPELLSAASRQAQPRPTETRHDDTRPSARQVEPKQGDANRDTRVQDPTDKASSKPSRRKPSTTGTKSAESQRANSKSARSRSATPRSAAPPAEPRSAEPRSAEPSITAAPPADQPALMNPHDEPVEDKPRSRRKRAQVPSWDEIMFGAPKKRS